MTGRVWGAFIALCTLSASAWCLPALSSTARLSGNALACTLIGIAAAVIWRTSRDTAARVAAGTWHARAARVLTTALAAAGVISGPALLLEPARALTGSSTVTAMLSLAPMSAAVTLAVRRGHALQSTLGACVLAVAGMLALLPIAEPRSVSALEGIGLSAGAAILAGASAVISYERLRRLPLLPALLLAAFANASVLSTGVLLQTGLSTALQELRSSNVPVWIVFDVASAAIALWLIRTMPPLAYVTRFLWAPLLASIEATVVFRPPLSWRILAGACMLASGGALLLRRPRDVSGEILGLR